MRLVTGIVLSAFLLLLAGPVQAQRSVATQTIGLVVRPVVRIQIADGPQRLVIDEVEAGSTVASVTDNSTTYSILSNVEDARITASIDAPVPRGTRLLMGVESTLGASAGMVDISQATQAVTLVTGIRRGRDAGRSITYTFSADLMEAGLVEEAARTIVLTILE